MSPLVLLLAFLPSSTQAPFAAPEPLAVSRQSDTPAPEARTPGVVLGTKEERVATAAGHYENNRPLDAALGFEGLWRDYPGEVRFLFNAAASRRAAGHNAHALAYTREYLQRAAPQGDDRVEADEQLRAALGEIVAVPVTLRVAPGGTGPVTIVAQQLARDSGDVRPELLFPVPLRGDQGSLVLELDPGVWVLRAQGAGYVTVEERLDVRRGAPPTPTSLLLARAPVGGPGPGPVDATVPHDVAQRAKLGYAISGGLAAGVGVAVTAVGGGKISRAATCEDLNVCVEDLARGRQTRDLGVMVLGGGLGLLAGGLTWAAKDPQKRRKAWIAEATIGGVGLVGGLVGLFFASRDFNASNNTSVLKTPTDWSEHHNQFRGSPGHAMAAVFFGAGAGLLVSAVPSLLIQRKYLKRVRLDAQLHPRLLGATLTGTF